MDVRFAYQANCWGPLGGNAVGVTSIGQLTYVTFGDMGRAIADIGAAGYQGVELFDGNVLDYPGGPSALKSALSNAGVNLVAVYSGANFIFPDVLDEELGRIARVADAAAALSAEHLVVGGGAKRLEGVAARRLRASGRRPGEGRRHRQGARPQGPLSSASVDDRRRARPRSTGSSG